MTRLCSNLSGAHWPCCCCCRGRPTDIYALGACLYTFVFGRIPFNAASVFKLFQVVQHEPLRFPSHPQVSHELKDLLLRMLAKVCSHPSGSHILHFSSSPVTVLQLSAFHLIFASSTADCVLATRLGCCLWHMPWWSEPARQFSAVLLNALVAISVLVSWG